MYAIVDIAGQQFKVEKDRKVYVHRLDAEVDSTLSFDKVLLVDHAGTVKVGAPLVSGAKVTAKVLA
ncbi:MAG: 50S ribosomal protein L21, partial [Breznakibacter sp.]|nr:50S ribosomal protein L21 [Breznakibacter sp.]